MLRWPPAQKDVPLLQVSVHLLRVAIFGVWVCSAWEAIGRELGFLSSHPGLRVIPSDVLVSAAHTVRALRVTRGVTVGSEPEHLRATSLQAAPASRESEAGRTPTPSQSGVIKQEKEDKEKEQAISRTPGGEAGRDESSSDEESGEEESGESDKTRAH